MVGYVDEGYIKLVQGCTTAESELRALVSIQQSSTVPVNFACFSLWAGSSVKLT